MKKKILIGLLLVVSLMFAVQSNLTFESDTITTTAAYATTTDYEINCQEYEDKFIHIKNVGASNSMYFKAWGYAYNKSDYYEEFIDETSIAASGTYNIKLSNTAYNKIVIRVKNNAGATTCKISVNLVP